MSVRISAPSAIRVSTPPVRMGLPRFAAGEPQKNDSSKDAGKHRSWLSGESLKRLGLWALIGSAAVVYPLYNGFQAYRLNKQVQALEARPELELLRGLETRGRLLQQIADEYRTLSSPVQNSLDDTVEILLKEYLADVKSQTAEYFKTHDAEFGDRLTAEVLESGPRFSKQSEEHTRALFQQVSAQLKRGESPWAVMGTYPTLLHDWIDHITPDIGPIHADVAKTRINNVFQDARETLAKMDKLSDEAGQYNYHMVLSALAGIMVSLLTLNIVQGQIIRQYKSR